MAWMVFVLLVAGGAVTGAMFQPGDWYAALEKPPGTPPNQVFGPVWTTLYVLIAFAGSLIWHAKKSGARTAALGLWGLQLVLNTAWSWLCFGRHELGWALVDIAALFGVIVVLIATARRIRPAASWLLVPYALWVGYASYLNWGLWRAA